MVDLAYLKQNVFPGESGGDYNALFGYANRPGGQFAGVNLTDMTVDQALAFADPSGPYAQSVKGQIGRVATPMGAYQIVGSTLRGAKQGLGLTGSERMTPELQDQLGMWIYQSQGPQAWEAWGRGGGGGNITKSTKGGSGMVGLLDMQESEPQTFGQRLKSDFKSGDLMDRLALAFNSLRMNPDQGLAQRVSERQQGRAAEKTANRTAQWLASIGRDDLAQAMMSGALDPKAAAQLAMQKAEAVNGVEVGGKLVNPRTGELIYDPTGGAAPTLTSDQLSGLNTLRDDAAKATTELSLMQDAWSNISTFYTNPGSVSDKSLVVAFAKILDPTSVVRESESAALANAGSLSAGMRSTLINTLQGGGDLPPEVRDEIVKLSQSMLMTKLPAAQRVVEGLQQTARAAGLPPELIFFGDLNAPPSVVPPTPTPTPTPGATPISPGASAYIPTTP